MPEVKASECDVLWRIGRLAGRSKDKVQLLQHEYDVLKRAVDSFKMKVGQDPEQWIFGPLIWGQAKQSINTAQTLQDGEPKEGAS